MFLEVRNEWGFPGCIAKENTGWVKENPACFDIKELEFTRGVFPLNCPRLNLVKLDSRLW